MTTTEFKTSTKTRMMYSLMGLGVATPAEAVAGIIAFYIVDVKNLPATWYATFWFFYTLYNAVNNPVLGYMSDRTRSRWGRRLPYILFMGLPYAVTFALLFTAPFDGKNNPVGLLVYFGACIVLWEGIYTALATVRRLCRTDRCCCEDEYFSDRGAGAWRGAAAHVGEFAWLVGHGIRIGGHFSCGDLHWLSLLI
jgi:hypothetical protein